MTDYYAAEFHGGYYKAVCLYADGEVRATLESRPGGYIRMLPHRGENPPRQLFSPSGRAYTWPDKANEIVPHSLGRRIFPNAKRTTMSELQAMQNQR